MVLLKDSAINSRFSYKKNKLVWTILMVYVFFSFFIAIIIFKLMPYDDFYLRLLGISVAALWLGEGIDLLATALINLTVE